MTIVGEVTQVSRKAVQIKTESPQKTQIWIPRSQIEKIVVNAGTICAWEPKTIEKGDRNVTFTISDWMQKKLEGART